MLLGWQVSSIPSDSGVPVFESLPGFQVFLFLVTSWFSSVPTKHASKVSTESATTRSPVSRIVFRLYSYYNKEQQDIQPQSTYSHSQHSHATTSLLRHNTTGIQEYLITIVQTNTLTIIPKKGTCSAKIVISN